MQTLAIFLALGVSFLSCFTDAASDKKNPPHILFIVADDLGWYDVGYHGSEIRTPNIDHLARGGVRLENYYMHTRCSPSRAALLSGRYPLNSGFGYDNVMMMMPRGLPLHLHTWPARLQQAGYATHSVGKWHMGFFNEAYTPTHRGFDTFYGYYGGEQSYFDHVVCKEGLAEDVCGVDLHRDDQQHLAPEVNQTGVYSTFLFKDQAKAIVREHASSANEKPLLLYLAFQAVHSPQEVPKRYSDLYRHIAMKDRRLHAGMTTCMDEAIGEVVDEFKEVGFWENTILVFTTDNGGCSKAGANNWPLNGAKRSWWEGGIKGVGLVHSPLLPRTGVQMSELMHMTDWFPTLASLSGASLAGVELDGYNMWDAISEGKRGPRQEILHYIVDDPLYGSALEHSPFDVRMNSALVSGGWKILTGNPGPRGRTHPANHVTEYKEHKMPVKGTKNVWLFDLRKDPYETRDVSDRHPSVVKMLLRKLATYWKNRAPKEGKFKLDEYADPKYHGGVWMPWQ